MKNLPRLVVAFLLTLLFLGTAPLSAQETPKGGSGDPTAFANSLKDATLKGTWAPIAGNRLGAEKDDSYQVVRAEQKEGDRWVIVWKVQIQGRTIEYPLPSVVKFAGDSAVLILDDVPTGDGKVWSARVLFHGDSYAGRWWGKDGKGGTVSGTITRSASE
jgi:hypothetical protein